MHPAFRSRRTAFLLFFFSGATSLVYEVLWLRQFILILGSTVFATSAVLSTFMAGLAFGSWAAGRLARRFRAEPLRMYGLLECGIGVYALAVPWLFKALMPLSQAVWDAGGADSYLLFSLAKYAGIIVVLLPPTFLMGASLPVLARQVASDPDRIGGEVGQLYATNTFGAVVGTFLAGFVAIPLFGVHRTLWANALLNLLIGGAAIALSRGESPAPPREEEAPSAARLSRHKLRLVLLVFALSGFAAMVLEVAWTRGLALILGSSVYAFSLMLLAFLGGLAVGAAAVSSYLRRRPGTDPGSCLAILLGATGALAYATSFAFQAMPAVFARVYLHGGLSPDAWFVVQFLFGLAVMFPGTAALGGIFPVVLQMHARDLTLVSRSVGVVYAANTLGTIVGAAMAGFLIVPALGVRSTLLLVSAIEVVLAIVVALTLAAGRPALRTALVGCLAVVGVLLAAVRPGWDLLLMNSGVYYNLQDLPEHASWEDFLAQVRKNKLVYFKEGLTSSVIVVDQPEFGNRFLAVNGKIEASTSSDMETQLMCGHLPLLLHDAPEDVLVIGLASGITAGAVACHPVKTIRVVEIEAAMVPAARYFSGANGEVLEDPRLALSINDARNELTFSRARYDAIVSEPSNPWMTVASNLFTEEFFRLARERLKPGGILCQWIQTYGLATEDLRSIVAAFRASFPHAMLFETFDWVDLLLLGSDHSLLLDLGRIEARMSELRVRMDLARVGIRRPVDILPLFRLGEAETARFVEGAARNTDDNARVEFSAPRAMYADTTGVTLELLDRLAPDPFKYVRMPAASPEDRDRARLDLARAWMARGDGKRARRIAEEVATGPRAVEARTLLEEIRLRLHQR